MKFHSVEANSVSYEITRPTPRVLDEEANKTLSLGLAFTHHYKILKPWLLRNYSCKRWFVIGLLKTLIKKRTVLGVFTISSSNAPVLGERLRSPRRCSCWRSAPFVA